jgi:DNA mismatch repair ATPase MutS
MASEEFYRQRAERFREEASVLEKTISRYSWSRLLVALMAIGFIYLGFQTPFYFSAAFLLAFLFLYLVQEQTKLEKARELIVSKSSLNRWEAEALNYEFRNFSDGSRFTDTHHSFSYDLDLFGSGSLFQYINRCATRLGENKLADGLINLSSDKQSIQQRQEAIRELALLVDFRQQCWATGKQIQDKDFNLESLWAWLKQPNLFYKKTRLNMLRWVMPVITCSALVAFMIDSSFQWVFFGLAGIQIAICGSYDKQITKLQMELSVYKVVLENYSRIFSLMKEQSFLSELLKAHHQTATEAKAHVKEVSSLINAIESRMNMIAKMFGNALFMYDLHTVSNLEKWREQHAASLPKWIQSLSEWDALLSFATLHFNRPRYAFAEINDQLIIRGENIGHPLIDSRIRVDNNFELGNPAKVVLITGANMAGKSTFLRAIGVNYILACNGSPVCATKWSNPCAELRTGMRTSDSLKDHQSYFYAELNRLQSIIENLRQGKPMIILLDEILKGTNSTDKQTGSRELIKQLIQQQALVLLATHDIALGDMEQQHPQSIQNACFEGKIENEQLTFDYKLHPGLAQKANATFLMRKMGIIPHQ